MDLLKRVLIIILPCLCLVLISLKIANPNLTYKDITISRATEYLESFPSDSLNSQFRWAVAYSSVNDVIDDFKTGHFSYTTVFDILKALASPLVVTLTLGLILGQIVLWMLGFIPFLLGF